MANFGEQVGNLSDLLLDEEDEITNDNDDKELDYNLFQTDWLNEVRVLCIIVVREGTTVFGRNWLRGLILWSDGYRTTLIKVVSFLECLSNIQSFLIGILCWSFFYRGSDILAYIHNLFFLFITYHFFSTLFTFLFSHLFSYIFQPDVRYTNN